MKQILSAAKRIKGFPAKARELYIGAICATIALLPASVFAAGSGIAKVDTLLDKIKTALIGAGVVVIAIALMWAGYKLAWCHANKEEIMKPVGGALIIGSAAEIAAFLMG